MAQFDPSTTISAEYGIFGLPFTAEESRLLLLPVPWEVTTSYGAGAADGPALVRGASEQIDLFDIDTGKAYEDGIHMLPVSADLRARNDRFKAKAQELIRLRTELSEDKARMEGLAAEVNQACEEMTAWVEAESSKILSQGKLLGLVGGDHSTPLGAIRAVSRLHKGDVGVLHIDAHADLRKAYQGFKQSHASIMYNVMHDANRPKCLVQVGIRDFCEEEFVLSRDHADIHTFYDGELKRRLFQGEKWAALCRDIVEKLPEKVYVSFDIDGLDPRFCPNTGTPVPGGLSTDEVFHLLRTLAETGRKIVAFDLNEVSSGGGDPDEAEWDGNVGARMLYKLCGWTLKTNAL